MVDAVKPLLEYEVVVDVPIGIPLRTILYPATPTLSVAAFQARAIWLDETTDAERLTGTLGAVISVIEPTVTSVLVVVEPDELVAVRVYVVETVGLTTLLPDNVLESMLGVIEIEVVLEVDQVRMVDEPAVIVLGEAEICPVGKVEEGGGGGGGGVTVAVPGVGEGGG